MSEQNESVSPQAEKSTPRKRSRLSLAEKVKRDSEEVLKQMGSSIDIEGGRKTRSSSRNSAAKSTPATPPPTKRAKASTPSTSSVKRGRPKRLDDEEESNDGSKSEKSEEIEVKKSPVNKKFAEKEVKKSARSSKSRNNEPEKLLDKPETQISGKQNSGKDSKKKETKETTPLQQRKSDVGDSAPASSEDSNLPKKGTDKKDETIENKPSASKELSKNSEDEIETNTERKNEAGHKTSEPQSLADVDNVKGTMEKVHDKVENVEETVEKAREPQSDELDKGEKLESIKEDSQEITTDESSEGNKPIEDEKKGIADKEKLSEEKFIKNQASAENLSKSASESIQDVIDQKQQSQEVKVLTDETQERKENQVKEQNKSSTEDKTVEKSLEIQKETDANKKVESVEAMDVDESPELSNNEVNNIEEVSMPSTGLNDDVITNDVEMIEANNGLGNNGTPEKNKNEIKKDKISDQISEVVGKNNIPHENNSVEITNSVEENKIEKKTDNTCDTKLSASDDVISAPQPCI